jgi:type I restriction-modification system DNA methylase subunit
VVLGNPPYLIVKASNTKEEILKEYKKFFTADFKINLFALFFEQAIKLGTIKGCQSFIIPDTSLNLSAFTKLRKYILHQGSLIHISYFNNDIFENVSVGKSVIITTDVSQLKMKLIIRG